MAFSTLIQPILEHCLWGDQKRRGTSEEQNELSFQAFDGSPIMPACPWPRRLSGPYGSWA